MAHTIWGQRISSTKTGLLVRERWISVVSCTKMALFVEETRTGENLIGYKWISDFTDYRFKDMTAGETVDIQFDFVSVSGSTLII